MAINPRSRGRTLRRGLGPNGACKTTVLNMLAMLLPIDSGEAKIFGDHVRREGQGRARQLIGVMGEYVLVDENLMAW